MWVNEFAEWGEGAQSKRAAVYRTVTYAGNDGTRLRCSIFEGLVDC